MRTIAVEITEILQRRILVEVPEEATNEDALHFVEDLYQGKNLALNESDFADVSFGIAG